MKVRTKSTGGLLAAADLLALPALLLALLATMVSPSAWASTAIGPDADTRAQSSKQVSYKGVSFTYDGSLASSVLARTVPEQKEGPDVPYWMAGPEHLKFEFKGFTRSGFDPAVYVFPVRS